MANFANQTQPKCLHLPKSSFREIPLPPQCLVPILTIVQHKTLFIDTILSVYAESKLPNKGAQIYNLIREDGNFLSLSAFNQFLKSLVSSSQFDKILEIFANVVDYGIGVDRFSYGKAIQSAVKLRDLKRGLELMNHMKKCGLNPNGFVYNVLIGGLCKQIVGVGGG
ncbi:Pentatricopeptide repeat-containing protein [Abeliophyllum distichum]|uniref:Pentatricopeptide repeat-containing protein n=1 Tax=Abeliophyllum distichum TaxID=126358 RepID=A0ABD1SFV1_9LAMI